MLTINPKSIKRGEIWNVDLNPVIGQEINKIRPCVVVNTDAIGILAVKLIAPITGWKDIFENRIWHVKIIPDASNNLSKISAVDALQLRGVSIERFKSKKGMLSSDIMEEIATAIAAIVEYR